MKQVNLAIVGATGMVGRTFLKVLDPGDRRLGAVDRRKKFSNKKFIFIFI